jgi:glycosyltransferase involved in cell wall biosynthesis
LNKLLMVAFHFPPLVGSSGIQRTLRFVQHLPAHGWQPIVLTANTRAYEKTGADFDCDVPPDVSVHRAFALDAARHLSMRGRYPGWTASPDRWASWRFDAVRQGMLLIRTERPSVIWSTYPIATAQLIGAELQRRSGLPWVADFRDPMAQPGYPVDPRVRAMFLRIEEAAAERAAMCVFATSGALRDYRRRYPQAAARMHLLENGYDEASFADAERSPMKDKPLNPGALTLLHSGIVYPDERDPEPLFKAVQTLLTSGRLAPSALRIRFRAPIHESLLANLAVTYGLEQVVEILPPVPYREALIEMLRAEALLIMQSNGCNDQVPAKLYEYLRARRHVMCLADPAGDTARECLRAGMSDIAALEDSDAIVACIASVITRLRSGQPLAASKDFVQAASRQAKSRQLAGLLDAVVASATQPHWPTTVAPRTNV